jgi:hypothetical protein
MSEMRAKDIAAPPKVEAKPVNPSVSLLPSVASPQIKLGGGFSVTPPPIVIPPLGKALVALISLYIYLLF